jgi:hypothetical protein
VFDPRVRERGDERLLVEPEQAPRGRRRGDLHQEHVVEADAVEGVLEREHALDLVRDDRGVEHLGDEERLARARQVIRDGEDRTQVVRRMSPLRGEPGVVVVEPPDQRTGLEGRLDRIELERGRGHAGPVRHEGAGDDRPEESSARCMRRGERRAPERVGEDEPRRPERRFLEAVPGERVARELREHRVDLRPAVRADGHESRSSSARSNRR